MMSWMRRPRWGEYGLDVDWRRWGICLTGGIPETGWWSLEARVGPLTAWVEWISKGGTS